MNLNNENSLLRLFFEPERDGVGSFTRKSYQELDYRSGMTLRVEDMANVNIGHHCGPVYMLCDFSNIQELLNKIVSDVHRVETDDSLLAEIGLSGECDLYCLAYSINYNLESVRTLSNDSITEREVLISRDYSWKLSQAVNLKLCSCVELSILAHFLFAQAGLEPITCGLSYFAQGMENPWCHAFTAFQREDKVLIYDPANPFYTKDGPFPAFFKAPVGFIQNALAGKDGLVQCPPVFTRALDESQYPYYGYLLADKFDKFYLSND